MLLQIVPVTLTIYLIYHFWYKRKVNFWKNIGIPSIGSNLFVLGDKKLNPAIVTQAMYNEYKWLNTPFCGIDNILKPGVMVVDVMFLRKVLVDDANYFEDDVGYFKEGFLTSFEKVPSVSEFKRLADTTQEFINNVIAENPERLDIKLFLDQSVADNTLTSVITFTLYRLGLDLEVQAKARQNVKQMLKVNGGEISYESIMNMDYIGNCIKGKKSPYIQNTHSLGYRDFKDVSTNTSYIKESFKRLSCCHH